VLNLVHEARVRHVKCDETKPGCIRCQKSGRKCDRYTRTQDTPLPRKNTHSPSPPTALPALPNFDNCRQREFFAFFVSCVSNGSSLYIGGEFWARHVLQLSISEAAVRYDLCSLSALRRMTTVSALASASSTATGLRSYALEQYNHAIKCTQTLLVESSDGSQDRLVKVLVACALFVCYENFTGTSRTAQMHLQNGLRIIAKERSEQRHSRIPKDIIQLFNAWTSKL
jgi:hypothetical protein